MIVLEQTPSPLISVVVLTFNSAATIQETLDSLCSQDYHSMEVLICDDGSTDSTQKIVQTWLANHSHLFKRAILLPSSYNEGICKNIQKGYSAARGVWLKPIAGDDLLVPQALLKFAAAAEGSKHDVIVSLLKTFGNNPRIGNVLPSPRDITLIAGPSDCLRTELIRRNPIPAPAVLLRRRAFESVGGIDNSFIHLDDWPLWMRFVEAGRSFGVLQEVLIQYRVSTESISTRRLAISINKHFLQDIITFYVKYQRQCLSPVRRWDRSIEIFRWKLAKGLLRSHPNLYKATRSLHAFSPLAWVKLLRRSE